MSGGATFDSGRTARVYFFALNAGNRSHDGRFWMTRRGMVAALCLAIATTVPHARAETRDLTTIWDVHDTGQNGQLTVYNSDIDGTSLGMPCGSGDLDHD